MINCHFYKEGLFDLTREFHSRNCFSNFQIFEEWILLDLSRLRFFTYRDISVVFWIVLYHSSLNLIIQSYEFDSHQRHFTFANCIVTDHLCCSPVFFENQMYLIINVLYYFLFTISDTLPSLDVAVITFWSFFG